MTGPQDWTTTLALIAATLLAVFGSTTSAKRLIRNQVPTVAEKCAAVLVTLLCASIFLYRALFVHNAWTPLESHVDGLTLMTSLLGAVVVYLQWTGRLPGLGFIALVAAAVMALWGVCASWWTLRDFEMTSIWRQVHLFSVYVGTSTVTLAAAAGTLWLYIDRQMRTKDHRAVRLHRLGQLASLESVEITVTRLALLGFVMMTSALATGLVIVSAGPTKLGDSWWYSPKVLLTATAWGIYAVVINVRHVATFRGRRAAILAIIGFVLLLSVMGIAQAIPSKDDGQLKIESAPKPYSASPAEAS